MNEKPKILHVNDCAQVGHNLAIGLEAWGVKVDFFYPTTGTYKASRMVRAALPIARTFESLKLRKVYREGKYSFAHVHYATMAYMAVLTGIPYYLHCHGADLYRDLYRPGMGSLVRLAIKRARKVFYSTPNLRQYLVGLREDAVFLPSPILLDQFQQDPEADKDAKGIFVISKLDKSKGIEENIETIRRVWDSQPNVPVTMFNFGDSPAMAEPFFLENQRNPSLKVIGRVPHEQIASLAREHAVILGQQGPKIGAMGVSEMEAMSCARPIVTYFAYPEAYPEPPPVFSSPDPSQASEMILRLLNDPLLRAELGRRSREWVNRYHDHLAVSRLILCEYGLEKFLDS